MFGENIAAAGVSALASYAMNERNIKMQQRENDLTRQREDNAYQRAVRDARDAGLSPLAVVPNGGASAQSLTAPQQMENPVSSGISAYEKVKALQIQDESSRKQSELIDSQVGLNNAQASVADADFQRKLVENSYVASKELLEVQKAREEVGKLKADKKISEEEASRRAELLDKRIEDLKSNIEKLDQQIRLANENAEYNRSLGASPSTSWSASETSAIGYGQATGKALAEQSANAKVLKKRQDTAKKQAEVEYFNTLKRLEEHYQKMKDINKTDKGVTARQNRDLAEKAVKDFKKNKSKFISTYAKTWLEINGDSYDFSD